MQRNGESNLAADETTETTHHRSLISNYGIVKVRGSRLTKAGAAFVFFIFLFFYVREDMWPLLSPLWQPDSSNCGGEK